MKKFQFRFEITLIIFVVLASPVYGAFENINYGARSLGMGSAFVSVADDANSIFNNPAGIIRTNQSELGMSYMELYGLVSYSSLSYIQKLKDNGFGIGIISSDDKDGVYQEAEAIFAYSRQIAKNLNFGANIRYLSSHAYFDEVRVGNGKGIAVDLGSQFLLPDKGLSFGIGLHSPIGIVFYNRKPLLGYGEEKYFQMTDFCYNIGASWDLAKKFSNLEKLLLAGELSDGYPCFGAEWTYANMISVRSGVRLGNSLNRALTMGLGFKLSLIKIDYAYISSSVDADTSQISVSVNW